MAFRCSIVLALSSLALIATDLAHAHVQMGNPNEKLVINDAVLCEACHAVVAETVVNVPKRHDTADVIDFLEKVCNAQYLRHYAYIPPKMAQACKAFLGKYDEEMEDFLGAKDAFESTDLEYNVCHKKLSICDSTEYSRTGYEDPQTQRRELLKEIALLQGIVDDIHYDALILDHDREAGQEAINKCESWLNQNPSSTTKELNEQIEELHNHAQRCFHIHDCHVARDELRQSIESNLQELRRTHDDSRAPADARDELIERMTTALDSLESDMVEEDPQTYREQAAAFREDTRQVLVRPSRRRRRRRHNRKDEL